MEIKRSGSQPSTDSPVWTKMLSHYLGEDGVEVDVPACSERVKAGVAEQMASAFCTSHILYEFPV